MIPVQFHPPAPDDGFTKLVSIVTRDGVLSPDFPMQCEPHAKMADDPSCKWPEDKRSWARKWFDWFLAVAIYD